MIWLIRKVLQWYRVVSTGYVPMTDERRQLFISYSRSEWPLD